MSSIALVDCNNFFVSCERVFNPKLINRPVVVLSCNDGCIIARSSEVKAWGVPMGAPYFEWADFLKARHTFVCSSNFALYADLSHRVMQTLSTFNHELEIYSIDEAFLLLKNIKDPLEHCRTIRQRVLQWTGIPISIGIASTKTLAKVANRAAKRNEAHGGVYFPSQEELKLLLETLEVKEIWGIGRRLTQFLAKWGIFTADHLMQQSDLWVKNHLTVTGLRTVWELRGISCLKIEEISSCKQSIMTSRSFGRAVTSQEELRESICSYAARGCEKLREEASKASWVQVFVMTRFNQEKYYSNWARVALDEPSDFTPTLLQAALQGFASIFRPGFLYKKAGVLLGGLVGAHCYQQDLFIKHDLADESRKKKLMHLMDQTNKRYGKRALYFASEGIEKTWSMKRSMCSAAFTTCWSDLLSIQI